MQRDDIESALGDRVIINCIDVDVGADVDIFCDAHDLPFYSATFDAAITTAVLEHVLYPEKVASEITRIINIQEILILILRTRRALKVVHLLAQ